MKQKAYLRFFTDKQTAVNHMSYKNDVNCVKGRRWVVIDGPENNYAVVDINTAIEMDCGYIF
ncbi:MAG: hypothetical protein JXB88_25490 [Spirochaetales bacterium]|nr:hypothetical protein [Spirochaetales bacterium]